MLPTRIQNAASSKTNRLLSVQYLPAPKSTDLTFASTLRIMRDPSHPLYLPARKRMQSFDPQQMYIKINWFPSGKIRPIVVSWAVRRVREALREELKVRGFDWNGKVLGTETQGQSADKRPLRGLLKVKIASDESILTSNFDNVKANASNVAERLIAMQPKQHFERQMPRSEMTRSPTKSRNSRSVPPSASVKRGHHRS